MIQIKCLVNVCTVTLSLTPDENISMLLLSGCLLLTTLPIVFWRILARLARMVSFKFWISNDSNVIVGRWTDLVWTSFSDGFVFLVR